MEDKKRKFRYTFDEFGEFVRWTTIGLLLLGAIISGIGKLFDFDIFDWFLKWLFKLFD